MKIAFLGLGIMGSRIARHLHAAGHDVTAWNRSEAPRRAAAAAGLRVADTAAAAVADAELTISMLANPAVVRAVVWDDALAAMPAGSVWADSSTVDPTFARESATRAAATGVRYLGTPVAGTRVHAQNKELKVLAGGPAEVLREVEPALKDFSQAVIHVGPEADRGAAFKILINGMLAQSMLLFKETLRVGEAQGLSQAFLLKVLPNLPVIAPFVQAKVEMVRNDDYTDVSFPLEHMHKDLHLLVQTAYEVDQPAHLAATAREVYGEARRAGRGRLDFSAV